MSKRLWVLPVLAAMLLVAGSGTGLAMGSLLGGTGVVTVPNALVAPMGQLQLSASYQQLEASRIVGLSLYDEALLVEEDDVSLWSIQALSGVANGAELWAAYSRDNSDFDNSTWGIGGKIQIPHEAQDQVSVAAGAAYRRMDGDFSEQVIGVIDTYEEPILIDLDIDNEMTSIDAFLVATADLTAMGQSEWAGGTRVLGSVGLLYKKVDFESTITVLDLVGTIDADDSLIRPFVAVEFLGADRTGLGLEYRWEDDDLETDPVFSAVLRHEFEQGFTLELGTTNADTLGLGTGDQNWFARVGYNFAFGQ